jgi:hypothetical protein
MINLDKVNKIILILFLIKTSNNIRTLINMNVFINLKIKLYYFFSIL